jgi:hypothetical protein
LSELPEHVINFLRLPVDNATAQPQTWQFASQKNSVTYAKLPNICERGAALVGVELPGTLPVSESLAGSYLAEVQCIGA